GVSASDNCGAPTVTFVSAVTNGGTGCAGSPRILTRTYRATDACGNFAECAQTITVEDNMPPVLVGVPADAAIGCEEVSLPPTVTATDCGQSVGVSFNETTSGVNPVVYSRVWSASDSCGNFVAATQLVSRTGTNLLVSIAQPVNGQEILVSPTQVLFTVHDDAAPVSPTSLWLLVATFTPATGAQESVVLVSNGVLNAGSFTNGGYALSWDPADSTGLVAIGISALHMACEAGSATSLVAVVDQVNTNPVRNLSTGVRFARLEDAMGEALPGQAIALRQGVHLLTGTVALISGVQVQGGYDAGWNRVGGPETTEVSGQGLVRCFYGSQLAVAAELGYMTIRGGYAGAGYDADGGALKLEQQGRATIHDCVFAGNTSAAFQVWAGELFGGGAVSVRFSDPVFARCSFASNTVVGGAGGAMRLHYAAPVISSCVFSANSAIGGDGGAIFATFSSPQIIDTAFDSNAAAGGGAVTLRGGLAGLRNDVFLDNGAGALSIENGGAAGCTNLSFAAQAPGAYVVRVAADATMALVNGIVFENGTNVPILAEAGAAVDVTYSAIEGGAFGTGNITNNPAWVNAGAGDVHLATNSPCVDAGSAAASALGLDGASGYGTHPDGATGDAGIVDMGFHYKEYGP
ncbi:MAG TPA: hypothetical protein VIH35_02825, partial [Kiritimatiellia bacterium]